VARLNSNSSRSHYRPDVDGLRAIAVISVVAYHAFPRAARGGFTGVDVFFVISGFLISGLILEDLHRARFSFSRFYARRFRRIFPALVVVLAACLVYGAVALAPDEFRELGKQAAAGAGFSSNLLQWSQAGYFDQKASAKPLLHLWSLGVEEQFYFAWPIVLVMLHGRARRFVYVCGSLLLLSFAMNLWLTRSSPSAAFYLPLPRFWELLCGALLAQAARSGRVGSGSDARAGDGARSAGDWRAVAGLAMILGGFFWIDAERAFPGWWALLPALGTTLLISAPQAWLNRKLLSWGPLVFVGLISYPLYLWHWVLLTFARIANFGEEPARAVRFAAIALSALLAWLTYRWVEKPIRFSGHRDAIPRGLIAGMAVCALAGAVIYMTDGFAFRYPAQIRSLAAFHYDQERNFYETSYRGGKCLLSARETFADWSPRCVDAVAGAAPLVALWGDSHAASLYPGLKAEQQQRGFRIAQFTASACPPVLGLTSERRRYCEAFNNAVLAQLQTLKPDVVILEAHWALYAGNNGWPELNAAALRRTIETLQQSGLRHIIIMGSLPTWKIYQPRVAFEVWRHSGALQDRTAEYLDAAPFAADEFVRDATRGTQATFISPLESLCREGACLISTDPNSATPLAWDNDHLSLAGSVFLVEHAFKSVLSAREPAL
jgi:peptidoglycan/LPS O-acetylase OafA/YrhL